MNNTKERENNRLGKKTGEIMGSFHARVGTIKDRNGKDLTEAEEIKKRWQELYKKGLNDLDNDSSRVTDLEQDILEFEVQWALGGTTVNTVSGGDRTSAELFQILKDKAAKVLHSICQQIWKTQQWPQNWKRSSSFQSQRRAMRKNVQTTRQLSSFHNLARLCSTSSAVPEQRSSRYTRWVSKRQRNQ